MLLASRAYQPRAWKRELAATVATADRVIIDPKTRPGASGPAGMEIMGAGQVSSLLAAIEYEPSLLSWHCMCFGECLFRFCDGDRTLLALSYHHRESLRIHDDNWAHNRNMQLTPRSQAAVRQWLKANRWELPECEQRKD